MTGLNIMAIIGRQQIPCRSELASRIKLNRNAAMRLDLTCQGIMVSNVSWRMN